MLMHLLFQVVFAIVDSPVERHATGADNKETRQLFGTLYRTNSAFFLACRYHLLEDLKQRPISRNKKLQMGIVYNPCMTNSLVNQKPRIVIKKLDYSVAGVTLLHRWQSNAYIIVVRHTECLGKNFRLGLKIMIKRAYRYPGSPGYVLNFESIVAFFLHELDNCTVDSISSFRCLFFPLCIVSDFHRNAYFPLNEAYKSLSLRWLYIQNSAGNIIQCSAFDESIQ